MIEHLRKYILAGLLAAIPVFLVYVVLRFIYFLIDQNVMNILVDLIGVRIPGLGLVITVLFLYLIGLFSHNLLGRWFIGLFERIAQRIPIIGTTYQVGKQISSTLSRPGKQVFKKVVLVNYLNKDAYTIGFVTGSLIDNRSGETLLKVFVPTPPNPASGTMIIVKESQVIDPGWTVDEGVRTVISGGIIGPEEMSFRRE